MTRIVPFDEYGVEPRMDAVSALGQHTGAVLAEPGYDRVRIDTFRAAGTIRLSDTP